MESEKVTFMDLPYSQQRLVQKQQKNLRTFCRTNEIKMKIEMNVKYNLTRNPLSLTKK